MSFENFNSTKTDKIKISSEAKRRAIETYSKQQPTRSLTEEPAAKKITREENPNKQIAKSSEAETKKPEKKQIDFGESLMSFFKTKAYEPPETKIKDSKFFTTLADARKEVGKARKELGKTREEIKATSAEVKNSISGIGKQASNEVKDFVKNLFTGWFTKKNKNEIPLKQVSKEVVQDNGSKERKKVYLQDLSPEEQYKINSIFKQMNEDSLASIKQAYDKGGYSPEELEKALKIQKELMEEYSVIKDLDVERFKDDIMNEKSSYKEVKKETPIHYDDLSTKDKQRIDEVFNELSRKIMPSQKTTEDVEYRRSMKKYNQDIADLDTLKTLNIKKFIDLVKNKYHIDFDIFE